MCKLYQSSTCAVYRQVVLTAQILLKAGWLARSPALEICELSLAQKKRHPWPQNCELFAICRPAFNRHWPVGNFVQIFLRRAFAKDQPSERKESTARVTKNLTVSLWLRSYAYCLIVKKSEKSGRGQFQRHISKCTYPILHLFLTFIKPTISCTTF